MALKRASSTLEKLRLKKKSSPTTSKAPSIDQAIAAATPIDGDFKCSDMNGGSQGESTPLPEVSVTDDLPQEDLPKTPRTAGTTNSGPTDPTYIPIKFTTGGRLAQYPEKPISSPRNPQRPVSTVLHSFLESDSESEDDEPVVGRASSVRMSKPNFVQQSVNVREWTGQMHSITSNAQDRPLSLPGSYISEASESTNVDLDVGTEKMNHGGPIDALNALEGKDSRGTPIIWPVADSIQTHSDPTDEPIYRSKRGGIYMNPVTNYEKTSIQRAISAPPLPQRLPSMKKVKIRPSDLITNHPQGSARMFREKVVTTPYPVLNVEDMTTEEGRDNEKVMGLLQPRNVNTVKSMKSDGDRFPSPDRTEVLFLDLGLARHPSATTTLEIKIADKNSYDDEMLFRQIRTAYRNRLLGISRLPFCLIRGVTHASVSPTVQYDFRTTEFMRHFDNPRIGRRRKTWVIWLRHHSKQHSPVRNDNLNMVRRPLSASLRTADKRLSMQSDSTSTFNFSFIPPLSITRIPFFNKKPTLPLSASTFHSPPAFGPGDGSGTIKVELHHEFSFWILALVYFLIVISSIAAVVLWIVFGVPGSRPGGADSTVTAGYLAYGLGWNAAAQTRVLTGLVLGMMVALLGSMVELSLIAGAYILL